MPGISVREESKETLGCEIRQQNGNRFYLNGETNVPIRLEPMELNEYKTCLPGYQFTLQKAFFLHICETPVDSYATVQTHAPQPAISMGEFACVPCRCTVPRDPKGCSNFSQVGKIEEERWRKEKKEARGQQRIGEEPGGEGSPPLGPSTPTVEGSTHTSAEGGRIESQEKDEKNVEKNSGSHWCSTQLIL